jgi:N-acetylneuraminic acid mutarotase
MTARLRLPVVLLVLLLAGGCVGVAVDSRAPIDQSRPGTWAPVAPMPTARQEVTAAALDGQVWVIGGLGDFAQPVDTVEVYDPVRFKWASRPPLPIALHHAAAAVVDGRLFVIGGYSGGRVRWTAEAAVYEWERQRQTWVARTPMPTPRGGLAVAVVDGRIHALGGSADRVTDAHEVYDPRTDSWTVRNAMPTARDHLAAVAFQGHVWAMGGRESFTGTQYANVEIYDPATDSWRTGVPLPEARGGLAAVTLADRIYVLGGEAPFRVYNAMEMYEVAGNRWIAKQPMPTARHGHGAVEVGGRIYVPGGGYRPGWAPTTVHEEFTP